MKTVYLSSKDTTFIYENLKSSGYYEWYIILACIEEIRCDYTFLSRLSWNNILNEREIIDAGGSKNASYEISEKIKNDVRGVIALLNIDDLDQKITGISAVITAKELEKKLLEYDFITAYNNHGFKFRIDSFGEYTLDKNGYKIYAERILDLNTEIEQNNKIVLLSLYVAVWADKKENERPDKFKLKHFDKKIGVGESVSVRMNSLSSDKRSGGTQSPMYVKAVRAWTMETSLCGRVESELHDFFREKGRNTGGEWFSDYYEDLIELVELKIQEISDMGHRVIKLNIDNEQEDITFINKLPKDFWKNRKQTEDDYEPVVRYDL